MHLDAILSYFIVRETKLISDNVYDVLLERYKKLNSMFLYKWLYLQKYD